MRSTSWHYNLDPKLDELSILQDLTEKGTNPTHPIIDLSLDTTRLDDAITSAYDRLTDRPLSDFASSSSGSSISHYFTPRDSESVQHDSHTKRCSVQHDIQHRPKSINLQLTCNTNLNSLPVVSAPPSTTCIQSPGSKFNLDSPNSHRNFKTRCRRESAPQISTESWLTGHNIPARHRRIKFKSPVNSKPSQLHGLLSPYPAKMSDRTYTDTLISLAWTGEEMSPTTSSGYVRSNIGPSHRIPKIDMSNATFTRGWVTKPRNEPKDEHESSNIPRTIAVAEHPSSYNRSRRWSLAAAINDHDITDKMLVEGLENMRKKDRIWQQRSFSEIFSSPTEDSVFHQSASFEDDFVQSPQSDNETATSVSPFTPDENLNHSWTTARRALLVCRELIHTEGRYLTSLRLLLGQKTQTTPPPLMLSHLPPLIKVSEMFLVRMETNPSVRGITEAFVEHQEEMRIAFTSWCSIVGEFFAPSNVARVKRTRSAPAEGNNLLDKSRTGNFKRRVSSWSKKRQSKIPEIDEYDLSLLRSGESRNVRRTKLSVNDLAIQPSQRITRYVLLFKELLSLTPPMLSSRNLVEQAVQIATIIANDANQSQKNSVFLM